MYLNIDKHNRESIAVVDDSGTEVTYKTLCEFCEEFHKVLSIRTLVFIFSENSIGSVLGYVACINNNVVPLILSCNTDNQLVETLINIYQPEYLWMPESMTNNYNSTKIYFNYGFILVKTDLRSYPMNKELALLLPTSGTTGSPKLVRHSYNNLESSALNVSQLFNIKVTDNALCILPMHYTMGLSVISSHFFAGATILLSKKSLLDGDFWKMVREKQATSFTGVPYSYEILNRLRFTRMKFPSLQIITQGGGKMGEELFKLYSDYAEKNGIKFIATYGQTEGTSRMAYLPANLAKTKTCSIGIAVPNGKLSLVDDNGKEIEDMEAEGELVYYGKNVTLGYATSGEDLSKGDENNGVLFTGDIARRDVDGCYFIIGRKKRFLKIYGLRIGLDEIESLLKYEFKIDCVCTGDDEVLKIVVTSGDTTDIINFIIKKTGLFHQSIKVIKIDSLPHTESGKLDMVKINKL